MLERELDRTLDTILDSKNPEIHHYHRGSHPGAKWYIKTIIPGYDLVDEDTWMLLTAWMRLGERFNNLICLTETAYDWSGNLISGWNTIWLNSRIDVQWSWDVRDGFDWKIVDFASGLKSSGDAVITWLDSWNDSRQSPDQAISYESLRDIAEFLRTYTDDKTSNHLRSQLKVIEEDEIFTKATGRKCMDAPS